MTPCAPYGGRCGRAAASPARRSGPWWPGMASTRPVRRLAAGVVTAAWEDVAKDLTEVETVTGSAWLLTKHLDALERAATVPLPVRLLPAFDLLLLGYADRSFLLPRDRTAAVNAGGGLIGPTVVTDAGVVATWRHRVDTAGLHVIVTPLERAPRGLRPGAEAEARDIGRFVGRPLTRFL